MNVPGTLGSDEHEQIENLLAELQGAHGWDLDSCLNQAVVFIATRGLAKEFMEELREVVKEQLEMDKEQG